MNNMTIDPWKVVAIVV